MNVINKKQAGKANPDVQISGAPAGHSDLQAIGALEHAKALIMQKQGVSEGQALNQIHSDQAANSPDAIAQKKVVQSQADQAAQSQADQQAKQARLAGDPSLANAVSGLNQAAQPGYIQSQPLPDATTGGQLPGVTPIGAGIAGAGAIGGAVGEGLPVVGGALAAVGAPVAATAGIAAALALGTYFGVEEHQKVKQYNQITVRTPGSFDAAINYANAGGNPDVAYSMFQNAVQESRLNEANLKAETDNELTKFLGAPGDELIRVQKFNKDRIPQYAQRLALALQQPDPTKMVQSPPDLADLGV